LAPFVFIDLVEPRTPLDLVDACIVLHVACQDAVADVGFHGIITAFGEDTGKLAHHKIVLRDGAPERHYRRKKKA
jgi:hypothetical protein